MGSSINSNPSSSLVKRKHFSVERRPKLLKDFLFDCPNSCSSSGFESFPRKPLTPIKIDRVDSTNINIARNPLARSRSKATSSTISALQSMINAVRSIHFAAVKPPSILPRSLSRKLSKKSLRGQRMRSGENKENNEVKTTTFTVKDIMRWRSFHDRVEVKSPPLDYLTSSPHHCTTTTTTTTTTSGSPSSTTPRSSTASSSSWCGSDFTSKYLPCWVDVDVDGNKSEDVVEVSKKDLPFVGGEESQESTTEARTRCYGAEGPTEEEEIEQLSPVCVIDFEFEEDEEDSSSSFDHSLASVERAQQKLMDKIRRFESLAKVDPINLDQEWMSMDENISSAEDYDHLEQEEIESRISYEEEEANCEIDEKAWQLLNDVKAGTTLMCNCKINEEDQLLLDFFRDELSSETRLRSRSFEFELELVSRGKRWMNGEDGMWVGWEVEKKREAHFSEMGKSGDWSKFEEEKEEVGFAVENEMVHLLVDELLLDLMSIRC